MVLTNRNRRDRRNTVGTIGLNHNNNHNSNAYNITKIIITTMSSMLVFHERSTRTRNHLTRPRSPMKSNDNKPRLTHLRGIPIIILYLVTPCRASAQHHHLAINRSMTRILVWFTIQSQL